MRLARRPLAMPLLALALVVAFATPGRAQQAVPDIGLTDDAVKSVMDVARQNITKARRADGTFVPKESPGELSLPIMPLADGRRIITAASLSAAAAWCGVEWQNSHYLRLMQQERASRRWSDKQMAYIGLLHGITQGTLERQHAASGACDDGTRSNVRQMIDAWWGR